MDEHTWLQTFIAPLASRPGWGPGDDAALVAIPDGEVAVLSVDTLVVDTHWRYPWLTDAELARHALLVALSDLAAMGARPLGVVFLSKPRSGAGGDPFRNLNSPGDLAEEKARESVS